MDIGFKGHTVAIGSKGKIMSHVHYHPTENPMKTGILGRCPRCQQGHLFNGFLKLAPSCEVCELDYSFADPADGPAFFAMTIVDRKSVV